MTNQYYYASFPSGHSNTIAAFCYGLTKAFGDFRLILLIAVPAVMASRVILGSHFLSDVIFGAYLGMTVTEIIRRSWVRYFEL